MIGGNVIRVTPIVTIAAYTDGDVLFNATEIPNAVGTRGGVSRVIGLSAVCIDADFVDCELIFHQTGGIILGVPNSQPALTDAQTLSLNYLGSIQMQNANWISNDSSSDSASTLYTHALTESDATPIQFLLKADEGSRSVYVSALAQEATDFASTTDLQLIFHVQYL